MDGYRFGNKKTRLVIFLLGLKASAYATQPTLIIENQIGSQNPWFAEAWAPFFNNEKQYLYADLAGGYSFNDKNGYGQLGLLFRQLQTTNMALGGYLYTSFNRSPFGQSFWTLNPGIEYLNPILHLNINGYLPVSPTRQSSGPADYASNFGDYNYVTFQGHNQYDQIMQPSSVTGTGADIIASYHATALQNIDVALGSYYFHIPNAPIENKADILGITTGITTPRIKGFSGRLAYSYDPLNYNTVTLGIRYSFDGSNKTERNWLDKPAQHNIATLGQANSIPIEHGLSVVSSNVLAKDNIWFFAPNNPMLQKFSQAPINLTDCTYENPCTNLDAQTAGNIAFINESIHFRDQPSLYLAPGSYHLPDSDFYLYGNESLIGRSGNYVKPAMGSERPVLYANYIAILGAQANLDNTVANLQLLNAGSLNGTAIYVQDVRNTTLDNLKIGSMDTNHPTDNFTTGIHMYNVQNLNLSNSSIDVNSYFITQDPFVTGILVADVGHFTMKNSQVHVISIDNQAGSVGIGVIANTAEINISDSLIDVYKQFSSPGSPQNLASATGLLINNGVTADVKMTGSSISTTTNGGNMVSIGIGVGGNSNINVSNSSFNAFSTNETGSSVSINFDVSEQARLAVEYSLINSESMSTQGKAASTSFNLINQSYVSIRGSDVVASAESFEITGSTNITSVDQATFDINNSKLLTTMSAEVLTPLGQEPPAAVSIWMQGQSSGVINDSDVIAEAGNEKTLAAVLQIQNTSQLNVNRSQLSIIQKSGNILDGINSAAIIQNSSGSLSIKDSLIYAELSGVSTNDLILLGANSGALVTIDNSIFLAKNTSISLQGQQPTYGIAVDGDGTVVYLNNTPVTLLAEDPITSKETNGGRVIITP